MRFPSERRPGSVADERGAALIGTLVLLMMMSALVAALAVNGQTETFISRNGMSAAQAQLVSEAGINHAVEVAVSYIFQWASNGCGGPGATVDQGVAAAVQTFLVGPDATTCNTPIAAAGDGSLGAFLIAMGIPADDTADACGVGCLTMVAGVNAQYEVAIIDDEPAVGEDGNLLTDANGILLIQSTGYAQDGTKVVLEARIAPQEMPAILANGDLDLDGNITITGPVGEAVVHANEDLDFNGSSGNFVGNMSASGGITGTPDSVVGTVTAGAARVPVPDIDAEDYIVWADFILQADGYMLDKSTGLPSLLPCTNATPCNNWSFSGGTWSISSSTAVNGTYYVEGDASISGSPGTDAVPVEMSVIAEGSIHISGAPDLIPATPELLFVTNGDLVILGNTDLDGGPVNVDGQMLVRGQVDIGGNASLEGQLIVANEAVGNLITSNSIHGSATITYHGGLGTGTYTVTSWRDVRDAD